MNDKTVDEYIVKGEMLITIRNMKTKLKLKVTHDKIQALFEVKMESKEELAKKMINSKAKPTYCTVNSTTLKIYVVRKR